MTSLAPDRAATADGFAPADLDGLATAFAADGFAILRGALDEERIAALEHACASQQVRLLAGELPPRCGTAILDDPEAQVEGRPFAHYVCHVTEISDLAARVVADPVLVAAAHRLLGPQAWLLDYERFGVVYQDARPGRTSGYSRIGWHSDVQSGPDLRVWPSAAFTIHIDATSPANGFLRVVPGSHLRGTDGMPPGFERISGEVGIYAERGDVLYHHGDLWHSAARGTDDGPAGVRRHVRGGWYAGERLPLGHGVDDFVKNAAR